MSSFHCLQPGLEDVMAAIRSIHDRGASPAALRRAGRLAVLSCAFALAAAGSASAMIWSDVTVVTVAGWEYRHVSVEVLPDGQSLDMIDESGARKAITSANVRVILDARGKDITVA